MCSAGGAGRDVHYAASRARLDAALTAWRSDRCDRTRAAVRDETRRHYRDWAHLEVVDPAPLTRQLRQREEPRVRGDSRCPRCRRPALVVDAGSHRFTRCPWCGQLITTAPSWTHCDHLSAPS